MERSPVKATDDSKVKATGSLGESLEFDNDTLRAIAEVYKIEENNEYNKKEFSNALYFYTEGIKVMCKDDELNAKLYSNRATAHFYLEKYCESLDDAKAATQFQPTYIKAIWRELKFTISSLGVPHPGRSALVDSRLNRLFQSCLLPLFQNESASACVKLQRYEDAITWCDKGLAINNKTKTLLDLKKSCFDELMKLQETELRKVVIGQKMYNDLGDRKSGAIKHGTVGNIHHDIGFVRKVIAYLELQLRIAKDTGDKVEEGKVCNELGVIYPLVDLERAIDYHKLHLKIVKELGDRHSAGRSYRHLGSAYFKLGDFKTFIHYHELHLQISKELLDRTEEGIAHNHLGNAYYSLGSVEKAIDYHERHLAIAKEANDREGEGNAYGNLGTAYTSLGNFVKAQAYHELQLNIAKERGDKAQEGKASGSLGNVFNNLGDFKKALVYHKRNLNLAIEVRDKFEEGRACGAIGDRYHSLGDFKNGIDFNERFLRIAKELGDKPLEGYACSNLGVIYESLGDFNKAIEYHELHLKISREVENRDGEARAYGNLGNTYYRRGDYRKAVSYHEQDLKITKEVGNRAGEGSAYGNLGITYARLGNVKKAMYYCQLSLEIYKEVRDRAGEGTAYNNLGTEYYRQGDYKKAITIFERRLEIAKQIGDKNGEAQAYCNLGNVYGDLGDYEKAMRYCEIHLKIAKEVGDKAVEGKANANLGVTYKSLGDFKKALHYHELDLKIAREVGDKNQDGCAHCNLGNVYSNLGNHQKAIDCFEIHLKIAKEVGNKAAEGNAYGCLGSERAVCNLGIIHRKLGNHEKAISCFEFHLRIAKEVGNKVGMAIAYDNLGLAFESLGSLQKARDYYQSSVELLNSTTVGHRFKDEWKISFRDMYHDVYTSLWSVLLKQDNVLGAMLAAEQGRAQALKHLMKVKYGFGTSFQQPILLEDAILDVLDSLPTNTAFIAVDQKKTVFWVIRNRNDVRLKRNEAKDDKLCDGDWCKFFESLVDVAYDEIGVGIDVKCEDRSLDKVNDEELASFRSGQSKSHRLQLPTSALRSLYDAVIEPIADLIHGSELIIVPDGPLCLAPFAAFIDRHSKYLCESFRIRLIPSLTSLKLITDCPADYHCNTGALLVGDPWVQEVTNMYGKLLHLEQLPGARKEVEMIGEIVKTEPLTGTKATKDEVLKRLPSVALVHIAAHGRMETGEIALCPNSSRSSQVPEEKDFLLTMRDVLNVQLRARLVVLSCCHSGRGEIKAEGVVGIARAFLGAGARSVLVSLWAIDDEATLEFMKSFYTELVKGRSSGEALNQAMKCMRESDKFSDVKYWAPFVVIGDDVTLEFGESD